MSSKLRLRPLALSDEATIRTAQRELAEDDFEFTFDLNDTTVWSEYLRTLDERRRHINIAPDRVPSTFLVAVVDGEIVGRTSIRHELNAWLAERGGHIGYGIRPGFRHRGYATETLRQSLTIAFALGIERVLITCDESNVASRRVIESNGGVLESVVSSGEAVPFCRYWIS
jgi:predicted acetyltransferase